ncbi:hypothetical protein [Halodesulfovibrio spirochaetisodalis]|uniref:Uncharacterized protein n=1 Tax=Halodesulfovibrio spirochaetisodalis TaxID=1560234 RepID=A0A1B7XA46_9BACT|nr:hypothetical protein [Halodesulfovibrio spirochaetisodalis]OBQ46218.1 hypothetical protein SP90_13550 [Halodesulfovibrio spirochaetisodalis]
MKKCPPSSFCLDKTINIPTILTILKSLAMVGVCAFAFYERIVDVEAQANTNAKAIRAIQTDMGAVNRLEQGVRSVQRSIEQQTKADDYQNRRIDDIYKLLTSMKAGK